MLLERGMIPQDTVALVALSSCSAALTGALSRRPAAATTRAVRRSIVDDLLLDFRESVTVSVFSSARSVVHFLLLHLYVFSDENPRYKFKSQFEFVLEPVSHCIGNIATDTVPQFSASKFCQKKICCQKGTRRKDLSLPLRVTDAYGGDPT